MDLELRPLSASALLRDEAERPTRRCYADPRPHSASRLLRPRWGTLALALALATALAFPASAITCRDWNRLAPDQKPLMINDLVQDAVNGSGGRSYNLNRPAVGRCMDRQARQIEYEFDDACFEPRSARLEVLNNIFKKYIWSCV